MATPTVSASLDKPSYPKGATMTLTVTYGDADSTTLTLTITATDASGNVSPPTTVTAVIDPTVVDVKDSSGKVWTKVSDTGAVAVFKATA